MSDSTIPGLPPPTQERVTRWLGHGVVAVIGVVGVITFMPFINKALNLLVNGVFSAIQLGLLVVGAVTAGFAVKMFWPIYVRLIESFANKATWAVLNYDPVTPMELWLKQMNGNLDSLKAQYTTIRGVIAKTEQIVSDNLRDAKDAQRKFESAAAQYGPKSSQALLLSIKPGTLQNSAERIKQSTQTLYAIRDTLSAVIDASQYKLTEAQADVDAFKQEYEIANVTESATNSANRVLHLTGQRKDDAMKSMKIIHDKFSSSFGRLQSLQDMSQDIITNANVEKGEYYQQALDRMRTESRMITGGDVAPTTDAQFTPSVGALSNGSFYTVPTKVTDSVQSNR